MQWLKAGSALAETGHDRDQVLDRAPEAVEGGHHEGVTGAEVVEDFHSSAGNPEPLGRVGRVCEDGCGPSVAQPRGECTLSVLMVSMTRSWSRPPNQG